MLVSDKLKIKTGQKHMITADMLLLNFGRNNLNWILKNKTIIMHFLIQ